MGRRETLVRIRPLVSACERGAQKTKGEIAGMKAKQREQERIGNVALELNLRSGRL